MLKKDICKFFLKNVGIFLYSLFEISKILMKYINKYVIITDKTIYVLYII